MKSLWPGRIPSLRLILALVLMLACLNAPAQTLPCIESTVKFILPPKTQNGWDVKDSRNQIVLADDFFCDSTGPITDIHIWGSWLNDVHGTITNFWLGIYDDVPAVTNFSSGIITPSHPGTNLLWQQWFGSQFAESIYTNGDEQFFDPTTTNIIGPDTKVYYYCFYPTNPFVQTGTLARPTNYWLAARAQIAEAGPIYGWKTSLVPYHDAAVRGTTAGINGLPIGDWVPMYDFAQQPLDLSFKLTTTNSQPPQCCPETNGVKYLQRPNVINGIDLNVSQNFTIADDFRCTNSGPVTDIHLWGSWLSDALDPAAVYTLAIWSDVPAGPGNPYSHPGIPLWTQSFVPGQYTVCPYTNVLEGFYQSDAVGFMGWSTNLYYLCFFLTDPANGFTQTGTPQNQTNYWLSVSAQTAAVNDFGWKTSVDAYNDTAVWANGPLPPPVWNPIINPLNNSNYNMAFKITTATNSQPPPTGCVETNGVKYVQWPDVANGADVWNSSAPPPGVNDGPWVLADDFICTNSGPITDIHIWGSWWYDFVGSNSVTFWLGIYDDVPANAANPFSHPGNLKWQQWFAPGQYTETFWSPGQETFIDPGPPAVVGTDQQVWYYCFYPTNPFVQSGSITATQTYWLVAYAQLPAGATVSYGWKTTTNVQHDISVHAPWPGGPPPANWPWQPNYNPAGPEPQPLDLAFKITTATNHCTFPYTCAGDKTVECTNAWSFDPPIIGPDPCCTNSPTVAFTVVTNLISSCQQIYTGTWTITDCLGTTVVCTQQVTVVDTTPPVITCSSNKVVQCGTAWNFDTPTAVDSCCGTNVTISVATTVTNSPSCPLVVTRTWLAIDCCGNTNSCSQTVSVEDTIPPTVFCPSNIVIYTCDTNAMMVTWSVTATDTCSSVTITSSPPSGSLFAPPSTNLVTVTARDGCGNTSTCSFYVLVLRPALGPLTITHPDTNIVVVTWTTGILQVSTNLIGPYTDVPGPPTSPYTNSPVLPMKYWRLRCASP